MMFLSGEDRRKPNGAGCYIDLGTADLADELRSSDGNERRARALERFRLLDEKIQATVSAGVSPDAFQSYTTIRDALTCVSKIITAFR
jgi:hypothetical protein